MRSFNLDLLMGAWRGFGNTRFLSAMPSTLSHNLLCVMRTDLIAARDEMATMIYMSRVTTHALSMISDHARGRGRGVWRTP